MKCAICGTERTHMKHEFKLKVLSDIKDFGAYVYNCQCPIYFLDELTFINENNIVLNEDNRRMMDGFKERLFSWMSDVKGNDGSNDGLDFGYRAFYSAYQDVNRLGDTHAKVNGRMIAAKQIHTDIWRYLYGLTRSSV